MNFIKRCALVALCVASFALPAFAADSLPSWNDIASKKAIVAFVEKVTKSGTRSVRGKPAPSNQGSGA